MSFNDNYESVSTVAHEWGHAMHSVLANAAQPYETGQLRHLRRRDPVDDQRDAAGRLRRQEREDQGRRRSTR